MAADLALARYRLNLLCEERGFRRTGNHGGAGSGLRTPLIDAVLTLASSVCGRDFWSEGRTLKKLGLDDLTVGEVKRLVRKGC